MLFGLIKSKARLPIPYLEVERHPCPFYGFNGMFGVMMDSKGNQCALMTGSYSPCQMEMEGDEPNWHKCPMNTEESRRKLEEVAEGMRTYPKEFHPPEQSSWEGISLKDWMDYILTKK